MEVKKFQSKSGEDVLDDWRETHIYRVDAGHGGASDPTASLFSDGAAAAEARVLATKPHSPGASTQFEQVYLEDLVPIGEEKAGPSVIWKHFRLEYKSNQPLDSLQYALQLSMRRYLVHLEKQRLNAGILSQAVLTEAQAIAGLCAHAFKTEATKELDRLSPYWASLKETAGHWPEVRDKAMKAAGKYGKIVKKYGVKGGKEVGKGIQIGAMVIFEQGQVWLPVVGGYIWDGSVYVASQIRDSTVGLAREHPDSAIANFLVDKLARAQIDPRRAVFHNPGEEAQPHNRAYDHKLSGSSTRQAVGGHMYIF